MSFAPSESEKPVVGRDRAKGESAAAALKDLGTEALFVSADLSEPGVGERVMSEVDARFGVVHGLVNAAAEPGGEAVGALAHLRPRHRLPQLARAVGHEPEGLTLRAGGDPVAEQVRHGGRPSLDGGGVDAHLVGPRPQQPAGVVHRAHAAAHGQGDEHLVGGAGHDVDHGVPSRRGGGDVEEAKLVRTGGIVCLCRLDGVAGVNKIDKVHALYDPTVLDVQARYHARFQGHRFSSNIAASTGRVPRNMPKASSASTRPS